MKFKPPLFFFIIFLLITPKLTLGDVVDSLLFKLENAAGNNRFNLLQQISEAYLNEQQYNEAYEFANKALIFSRNIENRLYESAALNQIANVSLTRGMYQSGIAHAENALKIAMEENDPNNLALSENLLGNAYYFQGDYNKARDHWESSLEIRQEQGAQDKIAILLMNLGILYKNRGDYNKAIEYYQEALKIHEKQGDRLNEARILSNIGNIYFYSGIDYDKALEYYHSGFELFTEIEDKNSATTLLNSIGLVYERRNDYGKALEYFTKALENARILENKYLEAHSLSNIGNLFLEDREYNKALNNYRKALNVFENLGSKRDIALIYGEIGNVYSRWKKYDEALSNYFNSISMMQELDLKKEILDNYHEISEIYAQLGEFKKAYRYYKEYAEMNDSIFNAEYALQITEWQTRYETEKKEQELAIQKAENQKKEAELKRKNIVIYSSAGFTIVILIFSVLLFKQYAEKRKANILLQNQNQEIKDQRDMIYQQNKEIKDSIEYASKIQAAMLPPHQFIADKLSDYFVLYKPRDIVSGDFYWVSQKEHKLLLTAADCTGHGVPGAFMSMLGIALLNEIVSNHPADNAGNILNLLRSQVVNSLHQTGRLGEAQDGMDIALCIIDEKEMKLDFAGAFNPLFLFRNGEFIEIKGDKMPIGIHVKQDIPFTNHEMPISKGDTIYLFSDGFPDQFGGPKRKKFLLKRFRDLLTENHTLPMKKQKKVLEDALYSWKGDYEQIDDILVFGMRIK